MEILGVSVPKASVIMTVYNTKESYLREAIESILNQTYHDFEFIIVDDCSDVSIENIVKDYKDVRIKFFRNRENLGVTKAPSYAFSLAGGEYVFKMDSDDIAHVDRLKKQIEFLDENPQVDVLSAAAVKFPKEEIIAHPVDNETIKNTLLFSHDCIVHPCVAFRVSSLKKFNVAYVNEYEACEDYATWLKYINELTFANLPDVLLKYRWHGGNVSIKKSYIQSINSQYIMFAAQGKYFSLDASSVLGVLDKVSDNKIFTSKDLKVILDFASNIKKKVVENNITVKYSLNRVFMKLLLKKCIVDFNFIKLIFSKELNDLIKFDLFQKLSMIIGI